MNKNMVENFEALGIKEEDTAAFQRIYKNILAGKFYGYYSTTLNPAIGETIFTTVLSVSPDNKYIRWSHFGSSANRNEAASLAWILRVIFEMSPAQFLKKYCVEI